MLVLGDELRDLLFRRRETDTQPLGFAAPPRPRGTTTDRATIARLRRDRKTSPATCTSTKTTSGASPRRTHPCVLSWKPTATLFDGVLDRPDGLDALP